MALILFLPIAWIIITLLWVWITLWINSYIIPYMWFDQSSNISIWVWMLIATLLVMIYFTLFTKNFESEKFKDYRNKE